MAVTPCPKCGFDTEDQFICSNCGAENPNAGVQVMRETKVPGFPRFPMSERVSLKIEVQVKKKTAIALKRLYESQESMTVLSKYNTEVRDVASAMMDDVLIDIRIPAKESIKQAIIAWDEEAS